MSSDGESPTQKRKRNSHSQPRAKRARYISIACNECKRRKIKCNGQAPCQRCGNLELDCVYAPNCCNNFKDSDEFRDMLGQISSLQQQIQSLYTNIRPDSRQSDARLMSVPASPYSQSTFGGQYNKSTEGPMAPPLAAQRSKPARFHGPTSTDFSLDVAKSSLHARGITDSTDAMEEASGPHADSPAASSPPVSLSAHREGQLHPTKDPIWLVSKDDAIRLVHIWREEVGSMYEVVDVDRLLSHVQLLFTFIEAAQRSGLMQGTMPGADAICDSQTITLKLVLAVALTLEASGKSEAGQLLFNSVRQPLEDMMFSPASIHMVRLLSLVAMFQFHRDEETVAWRIIGQAARLCIELGLHRRATYDLIFTNEHDKKSAVLLFWSVRVLDQRWSFGTGMPFAMSEADIDPLLQKPDNTTPYLAAMSAYSSIGSKVWQHVTDVESNHVKVGDNNLEYLDFQVIQWQRSIPEPLRYTSHSQSEGKESDNSTNHRLRILLYLRGNQMRLNILRPILHSAASFSQYIKHAQVAVDIARETIRTLTVMNQTTEFYRTQQVMFNYFLVSALAVLFLAVSHASEQFSNQCREEFHLALDIVRSMAPNSYVSRRLWKTVKGLKEMGVKLGLNMRNPIDPTEDAHSNAAVAMAGLAGHPVDELALFGSNHAGLNFGHGDSPNGLANDLTNIFEAVGANNGFSYPMATSLPNSGNVFATDASESNGSAALVGFGHQDEFSRILRGLF